MIYGLDNVLPLIEGERILAIVGRYGSGKSAMAFRLGYELIKRKKAKHLVSNIPCVWSVPPKEMRLEEKRLNSVVILDEAGQFLQTGRQASAFILGLRKLNTILILPSKLDVPRKVRAVTLERVFNAQVVGLPLWVYRWRLASGSRKDTGLIYWSNPHEIFGVYSTSAYPLTDGGFSKILHGIVREVALEGEEELEEYYTSEERSDSNYADDIRDAIDDLGEARGELEDTTQETAITIRALSSHRRQGRF